ncbi:hypothetical protein PHYPSEUDO_013831 [Phytophthora pseudosyringae]|uniref:Uncharacterized protein n=1 Tax=Phytophthora pseudosyringae TaxID=221518 RepID=A0A8T1W6C9_9STRA|nr:hypothetical protein PHYPSEUDO_013831 [Phytophthora pseudosyringae]
MPYPALSVGASSAAHIPARTLPLSLPLPERAHRVPSTVALYDGARADQGGDAYRGVARDPRGHQLHRATDWRRRGAAAERRGRAVPRAVAHGFDDVEAEAARAGTETTKLIKSTLDPLNKNPATRVNAVATHSAGEEAAEHLVSTLEGQWPCNVGAG